MRVPATRKFAAVPEESIHEPPRACDLLCRPPSAR